MKEKTKDVVRRVANEMAMVGKEPTIRSVRMKLGYGSASTIGPALREWRLELFARGMSNVPAKLPKELVPIVLNLWELAVNEAEKRFENERNELIRLRDSALLPECADVKATEHYKSVHGKDHGDI